MKEIQKYKSQPIYDDRNITLKNDIDVRVSKLFGLDPIENKRQCWEDRINRMIYANRYPKCKYPEI